MPRSNADVGGFSAAVEIVDELGDNRTDRGVVGRGQSEQVTVVFTANGMPQPGIWSPALGGQRWRRCPRTGQGDGDWN